jgi:serine/threonine protein kinase
MKAINYFHKNSIVHRSLKLENIYLKFKVNDLKDIQVKISDFKLSEILENQYSLKQT